MKKFKAVTIKCGNKLGYPCSVTLQLSTNKGLGAFEIKVMHGSQGYSRFANDATYAQILFEDIVKEEKILHS